MHLRCDVRIVDSLEAQRWRLSLFAFIIIFSAGKHYVLSDRSYGVEPTAFFISQDNKKGERATVQV